MRPDFRPFFIGGVSSFLLLGVGINLSITDADRRTYHAAFIVPVTILCHRKTSGGRWARLARDIHQHRMDTFSVY